jgi:hypothetical protein
MITLRDLLAFGIGLLVGAAGAAGAMWAVLRPVERIEALLVRAEALLGNRNANG